MNNLIPHSFAGERGWIDLFEMCYEYADKLHHFSEHSKLLVEERFPFIKSKPQIVCNGIDYSRLALDEKPEKNLARQMLSLPDDKKIFLFFGKIRKVEEMELIIDAWIQAELPNSIALISSSLPSIRGRSLGVRLRQRRVNKFRNMENVFVLDKFWEEEDLPYLFSAVDSTVVTRVDSLSSGVPCLAMTLGSFLIYPSLPVLVEYAMGSKNIGYSPSSVSALVCALKDSLELPTETIASENTVLSKRWTWSNCVPKIFD